MDVCAPCAYLLPTEDSIGSPRTGVMDGCEPLGVGQRT